MGTANATIKIWWKYYYESGIRDCFYCIITVIRQKPTSWVVKVEKLVIIEPIV